MDQPPADATRQAQAKADRVHLAFLEVLGFEKKRTAAQKIVVEHLTVSVGEDSNDFQFKDGRDGMTTALAAAQMDGAKSLLRIIKRQLKLAAKVGEPKPDKPNVIKR